MQLYSYDNRYVMHAYAPRGQQQARNLVGIAENLLQKSQNLKSLLVKYSVFYL